MSCNLRGENVIFFKMAVEMYKDLKSNEIKPFRGLSLFVFSFATLLMVILLIYYNCRHTLIMQLPFVSEGLPLRVNASEFQPPFIPGM
jgi:hypothetical protein